MATANDSSTGDALAPGEASTLPETSGDSSGSEFARSGDQTAESLDTKDLSLMTDFVPTECPELDVDLVIGDEEYEAQHGILVKTLQYPEFDEQNQADPGDLTVSDRVPPELWDTSEFPAGACIIRIRGINADCYANARTEFGHLEPEINLSANSFYFHQAQDEVSCPWPTPGCPTAEWGAITPQSFWWYLAQRENDVLFVACSDLCESFISRGNGYTLRLVPPRQPATPGWDGCSAPGNP